MPDTQNAKAVGKIRIRYRGRGNQIVIYLGKLLRMFLYQNDWKVLPMAAMVAGLVGLVIRRRFFYTMEGTMMSALAVTCVCIWNGCFNSIQVICRERDIIKREHRSGMHISSYILSHMIYQAMLCLLQTGITLYVTVLVGVNYPAEGFFTPLLLIDFFISLFLITYASDMMTLWISALCRSTTTAMTVMPVVLIFQLVFSGGMMTLPARAEPITNFIISNYGLKLITAQADYNHLPLGSAWSTVERMRGNEIKGEVTIGQVLDFLSDEEDPAVQEIRDIEVTDEDFLLQKLTVGDLVDLINANDDSQELRGQTIQIDTSVDQLIRLVGEDKVKDYIVETASATAREEDYELSALNILSYWTMLILFSLAFAALAMVTLEFIDHDKR